MPEIISMFKNDPIYPNAEYEPPFIFFGDIGALRFTIYCSEDCDFGFEWAVDTQYEVIAIDTFQALAGIEISINVPVTARYGRIFVRNIAAVPSKLATQLFFFEQFSSGDIESTGTGVSLVDNGDIKSLTSVDGSVLITDNLTEVDLSVVPRAGLVTVGTVDADYPTIYDAVADMKCNMRIITDVVETLQTDMTICLHLRLELVPGITLSNTIAGAGDWFIGDSNLLKIEGAGAHMDLTTSGLSSQIVLQPNQTFHWGTDAELDVSGVRFTGSGFNVLLSGSSRVIDCRFDGATRFTLDSFERNLFVNGCLFTVPITLDSLIGAEPKTAIISNNTFTNTSDVYISGANDLIFNGNIVGNDIIATGTLTNTKITDNRIGGNLDLVALVTSTVSDNVITGNITAISNTNSTLNDNHFVDLTFSGAVVDGVISANEATGDITFTLAVNDSIISTNSLNSLIFLLTLEDTRITGNAMKSTLTIAGASNDVVLSSNVSINNWTITGNINNGSINNNRIGTSTSILTFGGIVTSCTMTGTRVGLIRFNMAVIDSNISGNVASRINFLLTVNNTQITGNNLINSNFQTLVIAGASDRVVISSNVGFHTWVFTGNFNNGTISNNRVSLGGGSGSVVFGGSFIDSAMSGNTFEGDINIAGLVAVCSISSNTVNRLIFGSTMGNTQVIGNTLIRTGLTTLTITGASTGVIISSNLGYHSWALTGDFSDGTISDNRISVGSGTGSIIVGGIFSNSTMTGNSFSDVTLTGNVTASSISSNTLENLLFSNIATDVAISSNYFSGLGNSFSIVGVSTRVVISGNTANNNWLFSGNFVNGSISGNKIDTTVTIQGIFIDSIFGDNTLSGSLTITGGATRCVIKGNYLGVSILINLPNTYTSTNNAITGNVCASQIRFGALGTGIVGNIISGNVVPTSITTAASNNLNNLVTSNRTPVAAIAGFGGTDVVVANI